VLIANTPDLAKAKTFIASADLQAAMKGAGVIGKPDVYFLDAAD
jgi:hypothetical protein